MRCPIRFTTISTESTFGSTCSNALARGSGPRLHAPTALRTLADTMRSLHFPDDHAACPVLHMDIKPSNLMVLTNGEVRLIDFTGARYWRHEEITQIAYTADSGGPEALQGQVSPSYDVHGFGSVAFFISTGAPPRSTSTPMDRHPVFEGRPALRDHVLALLADRPADRPAHARAARLDRASGRVGAQCRLPDLGLDWSDRAGPPVGADGGRAVGRARPVLRGTETDAFHRIELLERELVALRANAAKMPQQPELQRMPAVLTPPGAPVSGGPASVGSVSGGPASPSPISGGPAAVFPSSAGPVSPGSSANGDVAMLVGRAQVVNRPPAHDTATPVAPQQPARVRVPMADRWRVWKRGQGWTWTAGTFAALCWIIWAAASRPSTGIVIAPSILLSTILVGVGLFVVLRLVGRLVIEGWMHRKRRTARGAHIGVAIFLYTVGVTYLQQTAWVVKVFTS